jgi:peptidoglycan/xylan/chitin deacetylase (PgdA/CDA1 family)
MLYLITTLITLLAVLLVVIWHNCYLPVLPIVLYHRVNPLSEDENTITPDEFEKQLIHLEQRKYNTIFLEEAYALLYKGKQIPPKTVVLTFDLGFIDTWIYAFPLLQKYNMKATIFLATDFISNSVVLRKNAKMTNKSWELPVIYPSDQALKNALKGEKDNFLSWLEIKAMQKTGLIDIQSHTSTCKQLFRDDRTIDTIKDDEERSIPYEHFSAFHGQFKKDAPYFKTGPGLVTKEYINDDKPHFESVRDYSVRIQNELKWSKETIEFNLFKPCQYLSWPFGASSLKTIQVARQTDYKMALGSKPGPNFRFTNRFNLYRFQPESHDNDFCERLLRNSYLLPSVFQNTPVYDLLFKAKMLQEAELS